MKEQPDCVFNVHHPGHNEEVTAKAVQVVTVTLCPQNCSVGQPAIRINTLTITEQSAKEETNIKHKHREF